ncbi:proteasome assembly chaperone 2-like [Uloborus diversus]|uniref:proteasome assembly chaperone 2-like n=1 Tax=Uloborus diversus TaxID=327109 RepID=UPI00240A28FA|nr:proteasome assembly chaperone 2-like [Uloborus diversus]
MVTKMSVFWDENKQPIFEDYIFILPSISVGNVGQLAVDLLLNNLEVKHVAFIEEPSILPIVGPDPFDPESTKLATSCELFQFEEKKLLIMQQRAPIIPEEISRYKDFITNFIKSHKFKKTVLLSSSFSQFFTAENLQGVPIHYLLTSTVREEEKQFENISWRKFQLPQNVDPTETSLIPGGGIAAKLLKDCEEQQVPLVVLILVCSEGNNYPEALQMVKSINQWLQLKQTKDSEEVWKIPISWALPYGSDAPHTMF